jgi:hypothetical protein
VYTPRSQCCYRPAHQSGSSTTVVATVLEVSWLPLILAASNRRLCPKAERTVWILGVKVASVVIGSGCLFLALSLADKPVAKLCSSSCLHVLKCIF